jgi:outer membrane protein TolC
MPRHRNAAGARLLPVVLALLAVARPAAAQDPDTVRLSLAEAVRRALERGEEILSARAQLAQAQGRVTQAAAVAYPQVATSLTYNRAIRTIFDNLAPPAAADTAQVPDAFDETRTPQERYDTLNELLMQDFMAGLISGLPFGRRNTYLAAVQVAQPLFTGGRISGTRTAARHYEAAAHHQLDEAEAEVVLQVRVAYMNAVLAARLQVIARDSRRSAEAHYRQVQAFREAGTSSEFDLLRARVDFENREPLVVQADNAARLALLEVKRLVNLPAEQAVELTSTLDPSQVRVDEDGIAGRLEQRPLLLAAREGVAVREAGLRVARGEWFPTVSLVGNFGFQAYPSSVAPPGFSDWRQDWSVALAVSWTPFDGFGRRGRIAEAQAALRDARAQQAQVEEGLHIELAAAMGEYRTAQVEIAARRQTVGLAEETLELAQLRFANGLATQLDVSDAALLLDEARVNEIRALHDLVKALARLERLSGGQVVLLAGEQP